MPKIFTVNVAERWVKYHTLNVVADDEYEAGYKAVELLEENSDVDFAKAEEAGLEFIELEAVH